MHLSTFGLISLNGSVKKPEPSLSFSNYQTALAQYSAAIALRDRVTLSARKAQSRSAECRSEALGMPAARKITEAAANPSEKPDSALARILRRQSLLQQLK